MEDLKSLALMVCATAIGNVLSMLLVEAREKKRPKCGNHFRR